MSDYFPLRYWCPACGQLLFRSDQNASGLIEAVCTNRRCPSRQPRVVRIPDDAAECPLVRRFRGRIVDYSFRASWLST